MHPSIQTLDHPKPIEYSKLFERNDTRLLQFHYFSFHLFRRFFECPQDEINKKRNQEELVHISSTPRDPIGEYSKLFERNDT